MANGVTKEEGERIEFTMAMDSDRLAQCEALAKTKGINRTAFMRLVIYEYLDAHLPFAGCGSASGSQR